MLDAKPAKLTKLGRVEITADQGINIVNFDGEGVTCRDVAALAMVWAIGELQRELELVLKEPGLSGAVVD